jgi:hypothetical protein
MVEKGILGRKVGKGFYLYPKDAKKGSKEKALNPEVRYTFFFIINFIFFFYFFLLLFYYFLIFPFSYSTTAALSFSPLL